MNRAEK